MGVYTEIPAADLGICWAGRREEEQRVEKREEELDERQGREIYVRGQIKSLTLSMANFLFSFIVYSLPDLGGQCIRLCYYIQPLVITGNCATHLAKHIWSQWDCLNLTEDLSVFKDLERTLRSKWKPGGSEDTQHVEKRSLNIRCDCATILDVCENFVLSTDLWGNQWDDVCSVTLSRVTKQKIIRRLASTDLT